MKQVYEVCKTVCDAQETVRFLMYNGISSYRQGTTVYIDDGGEDVAL